MGHTRLGAIPKSRKWDSVVAIMLSDEPLSVDSSEAFDKWVRKVSAATLGAAQKGLQGAVKDIGLRYTFYLLTQLALASRQDGWQKRLEHLGIRLRNDATPFALATAMQQAIDDFLSENGRATDVSEIAQEAAGDALCRLLRRESVSLFGSGSPQIQQALFHLSTQSGFSRLGQLFFGGFMARFLNFYLSRATAGLVGGNRLSQVSDLSRFNEALQLHCEESAQIVRSFCGDWYSKTEYQEGIGLDNTSRFMAVALRKLSSELQIQAGAP